MKGSYLAASNTKSAAFLVWSPYIRRNLFYFSCDPTRPLHCGEVSCVFMEERSLQRQRFENFGGHGHSDTRFFYKKNLHKKMSLKNPKTLGKS